VEWLIFSADYTCCRDQAASSNRIIMSLCRLKTPIPFSFNCFFVFPLTQNQRSFLPLRGALTWSGFITTVSTRGWSWCWDNNYHNLSFSPPFGRPMRGRKSQGPLYHSASRYSSIRRWLSCILWKCSSWWFACLLVPSDNRCHAQGY